MASRPSPPSPPPPPPRPPAGPPPSPPPAGPRKGGLFRSVVAVAAVAYAVAETLAGNTE